MVRWWLVLVLVMASAIAWAEPASQTDQAQARVVDLDRSLATQLTEQHRLQGQFDDETTNIARLKQRKRSWANDRELNTSQAEANETAQRLEAVAGEIKAAQAKLAAARKALVDAIDTELAASPADARRAHLAAMRAQVAPQIAAAPRKIVIPNSDIDPTADADELEKEAAALRQTEGELQKQEDTLKTQADQLDSQARMRREHERANEVSQRDDDQSHRTTGHNGTTDSREPVNANPSNPAPGGGAQIGGGAQNGNSTNTSANTAPTADHSEGDAAVVLADVVDASTIKQLKRAQGSNDPKQRATAAKAAQDEVAAKRDSLRRQREAIESRARQLRGGK